MFEMFVYVFAFLQQTIKTTKI